MIKITLDTCCFETNSLNLFLRLKRLQELGKIEIWHELYSENETEKWQSEDKTKIKKLFHLVSKFKNDACFIPTNVAGDSKKEFEFVEKQRGYSSKEIHETHLKINKILHPEGLYGRKILNKYIDGKILALHVVRKRDLFVSKDGGFFKRGKKEKLEKEFPNIKIKYFNKDFIKELEEN